MKKNAQVWEQSTTLSENLISSYTSTDVGDDLIWLTLPSDISGDDGASKEQQLFMSYIYC